MKKFFLMAAVLLIFSGYASAQQTSPANSKAQQKTEVKKGKVSGSADNGKTLKNTDSTVVKIKIPPMPPDTVGIPRKEE